LDIQKVKEGMKLGFHSCEKGIQERGYTANLDGTSSVIGPYLSPVGT